MYRYYIYVTQNDGIFVGGNNEEATNSEMERLKAEQSDKFNVRDMNEYDGRGIHKISFIAMRQKISIMLLKN